VTTRQVQRTKPYLYRLLQQPRWTTFWLLSVTTCFIAIFLAWFANIGVISQIFCTLNDWQQASREWLQAPSESAGWQLSLALLVIAQGILRISPKPRAWSKFLLISILLVLVARYLLWRSLATLNLSSPFNGLFSLLLLGMEAVTLTTLGIQLFLMLRERDRSRDADRYSVAVESGNFVPTVDVLIPTFNEPPVVLRRTIVGCQALEYPSKQIYLLDDGKREEIRQLAEELGCHYLARPVNRNAKAGNLNYGLRHTSGELVVVFDADFVPTRNFLIRTVGFFQKPAIALVQTHQCFYNPDQLTRNLGLEKEVPHETEVSFRHYLLLREGSNSTPCYGSSFVMRRSALEEVGGFVTKSISEDLYTGIRMTARGYQTVYLNENLSAGLVPEDLLSQLSQRQRWGRGTLQAFFIKENPLTIPGLTLLQRIAYFEAILQWFNTVFRMIFLLVPIAIVFLGVVPFVASLSDWAYFFLPLYCFQMATFAWLRHRAFGALLADIYSVVLCIPLSATILHTLISPFSKGFQVTPKGTSTQKTIFRWKLAIPLIVLWILTGISAILQANNWVNYAGDFSPAESDFIKLGALWSSYNLFVIGIAILGLFDRPKPTPYEWFEQQRTIQLEVDQEVMHGVTVRLSEIGAEVRLAKPNFSKTRSQPCMPAILHFPSEELSLKATILHVNHDKESPILTLGFDSLSTDHHRRLIELLFCNPGQWQCLLAPGELRSIWLLLRSLFRSRVRPKVGSPIQ
jgi:cellulose synthase (UDP-forming)